VDWEFASAVIAFRLLEICACPAYSTCRSRGARIEHSSTPLHGFPGLTMPQRLELLNASINPDEVLYQNRRKAAGLRRLVEAEKDPSLRAFMLPQYASSF